jgi:hypothetical protein
MGRLEDVVNVRRNEPPHSGVLTSVTAQGGEQNRLPRVNLDSGNGSEEDGVENRSEPQGWLADGSPGNTGSTQDAENAASVKTVPPMFGMGPGVGSPAEAERNTVAHEKPPPPPISGHDDRRHDDHQGWGARLPDPPSLATNGTGGGSSTAVPAGNWPSSPGTQNQGHSQGHDGLGAAPGGPPMPGPSGPGPLAGPGGPAVPGRYPPPRPRDYSGGTTTFPRPSKGKVRPPRPAKPARPSRRGRGEWSGAPDLPAQSAASSRKAQLAIARIEPWSVMKFSFMISLVGWVILFVAVAVMYFILKKIGVFTSIEHTVGLITSSKEHAGSNASSWFSASRVLGYTMLVGAVNVILITALSTVGAVLYNLVTMIAGGVEVTLKEAD